MEDKNEKKTQQVLHATALTPEAMAAGKTTYILMLVLTVLGRVFVTGAVHAIGTQMLPKEERGTPWLRGVVLGAASPSAACMFLAWQYALPYAIGTGLWEDNWLLPAATVGLWLLGIGCSAAMATLGGVDWRRPHSGVGKDSNETQAGLDFTSLSPEFA
jgi:hypothetical protein